MVCIVLLNRITIKGFEVCNCNLGKKHGKHNFFSVQFDVWVTRDNLTLLKEQMCFHCILCSWTLCWKTTSPQYEPWRRCKRGSPACRLRSSCDSGWITRWAALPRSFIAKPFRGYMETKLPTSLTASRETLLCLYPSF